VDFQGGVLTTDPGLLLLRELDHTLELTNRLQSLLDDRRDPRYVVHRAGELLQQRIYQIAAGYEDAIDSNRLRLDPTFQTIVKADGPGEPLATQSTMSRLENSATWRDVQRLTDLSFSWFLRHGASLRAWRGQEIILDLDTTEDPTHGHQQLALFHGKYDTYMYHPLLIFEGGTGHLLCSKLRPGTVPDARGLLPELRRMVPALRRSYPEAPIRLRGDAGFASPELYRYLDGERIEYLIGIPHHPVFHKLTESVRERARRQFEETGEPVRLYSSFYHRGKKWSRTRRILVKVEVSAQGTNVRCVITNRPGRAEDLFEVYRGRGKVENWIDELKTDLKADRLSCSRYRANAFRLQLHTLAFNLLHLLRHWLSGTALARAETSTIRLKLFKVGAQVKRSVRRIWFHLATGWPYQDLFVQVFHAVRQRAPAFG
jgi:hypothetical protein